MPGPATLTFDNSPARHGAGRAARLHRRRATPSATPARRGRRRERVLACFARLFGERALAAGALHRAGLGGGHRALERRRPDLRAGRRLEPAGPALREPPGRMHWAGTESATRWAGFMDGAVSSGESAAAAILAARH